MGIIKTKDQALTLSEELLRQAIATHASNPDASPFDTDTVGKIEKGQLEIRELLFKYRVKYTGGTHFEVVDKNVQKQVGVTDFNYGKLDDYHYMVPTLIGLGYDKSTSDDNVDEDKRYSSLKYRFDSLVERSNDYATGNALTTPQAVSEKFVDASISHGEFFARQNEEEWAHFLMRDFFIHTDEQQNVEEDGISMLPVLPFFRRSKGAEVPFVLTPQDEQQFIVKGNSNVTLSNYNYLEVRVKGMGIARKGSAS